MISVRITEKQDQICALSVKGHAGSAEHGKDLVCAAVSGIVFGLCNALDELAGVQTIEIGNNRIEIRIEVPDEKTELILRTGIVQLKTVSETNQNFIKITEVQ
ncbi:MAG: ribosomal-processing cysteine protease Prp [Solobacterium sp.]|nr:ribosomal-processing cysteine protease Prp [Solobacterium sp.]